MILVFKCINLSTNQFVQIQQDLSSALGVGELDARQKTIIQSIARQPLKRQMRLWMIWSNSNSFSRIHREQGS